jgi:hypothetical protein
VVGQSELHPLDREIALIYFDPTKRSQGHFIQLESLIAQVRQCAPAALACALTIREKAAYLASS